MAIFKTETKVESTVAAATVFLDRAMVYRVCKVELKQGRNLVKVEQLPLRIESDSFRVKGGGTSPAKILDVKLAEGFMPIASMPRLAELKQQATDLEKELRRLDKKRETFKKGRTFIDGFQAGFSKEASEHMHLSKPSVGDWTSVTQFILDKNTELDDLEFELENNVRELKDKMAQLQAEIQKYAGTDVKRQNIATVEIEVVADGDFVLEISYLTRCASWKPSYDARVDSKSKLVGFTMHGIVTQYSGEDWKEVSLHLSTAKPNLGATPPGLRSWYVSEFVQVRYEREEASREFTKTKAKKMLSKPMESAVGSGSLDKIMDVIQDESDEFGFADANVAAGDGGSVVFICSGSNDVPGNNTPTKVRVMEHSLSGDFEYFTVPKLSAYAYLTAKVKNSSDYPFLAGKISIFIDDSFVGSSDLSSTIHPAEPFDLRLGIDESIKITYKVLGKKHDQKGIFSKNATILHEYVIEVDSKRDSAEKVVVWDQLPVSTNEKIKITPKSLQPEPLKAAKNDVLRPEGTLEWVLNLAPKEKKSIAISFLVEHPTDMQVSGL